MKKALFILSIILLMTLIFFLNCPITLNNNDNDSTSGTSSSLSSSSSSASTSSASSSSSSSASTSSASSSSSSSASTSSASSSSSSSSQQPNIIYNLNSGPGSGWTVGSANCDWEWGTVSSIGPIGAVCYGTNIDGYYENNRTYTENYVQVGPLNFSGFTSGTGFRMTFDAYFYLNNDWDFTQIQYSTNGTSFNAITSTYVSGYPYTHPGQNAWSPNFVTSGHEPQWRSVVINLGGMSLNGQTLVYFRWVLESDISDVYPGLYIDNINIGY